MIPKGFFIEVFLEAFQEASEKDPKTFMRNMGTMKTLKTLETIWIPEDLENPEVMEP